MEGQRCLCAGLRGHMAANMEDSQTHKSFVTCHDECGSIRGFVSYLCLGLSEPTEHLCPTLVKPKPLIVEKAPPPSTLILFCLFIVQKKVSLNVPVTHFILLTFCQHIWDLQADRWKADEACFQSGEPDRWSNLISTKYLCLQISKGIRLLSLNMTGNPRGIRQFRLEEMSNIMHHPAMYCHNI